MHKVLLLSISLVFISFSVLAEHEESTNTDCATLGYKTDTLKCLEEKGRPLVCPYSGSNASKCICIKESCRGYDITAEDKKQKTASDGRSIDAHILSYEECTIGSGEEELTLYRVKECAEGSLYQNGLCDVGCDTINKYPYLLHPGNLAGEVEICKDALGEYFGYKECNDGWSLSNGRCNLNDCDIKTYPYNHDPNLKEVRGVTKKCLIGGNAYYKYESCNTGYEISPGGGVCIGNCKIDTNNCSLDENNNWTCPLVNKEACMIGDNATIGNKVIGTIFHISDDKVLVMDASLGVVYKSWAYLAGLRKDVPNLVNIYGIDSAVLDIDGKQNTNIIKAYVGSNLEDEINDDSYPAASMCYNHTSDNCNHDMCQKGEWYLGALGEVKYMYDNRYILYQVTGLTTFSNNTPWFWSSTEFSADSAWLYAFSGEAKANSKSTAYTVFPILSF